MGKNDPRYIRLDDEAEAAVADFLKNKGGTRSSAINMIIREWAEMKKQYVTVPVGGAIHGEVITGKGIEEISIEEELDRR